MLALLASPAARGLVVALGFGRFLGFLGFPFPPLGVFRLRVLGFRIRSKK